MSTLLKKAFIGGLAALTFGLGVAETSAPAMAQHYRGHGGFHGGYRGGYHGGGWHRGGGWGPGIVGGLALGAIAAGAAGAYGYNNYYGYGYGDPYGYGAYGGGCVQQTPVYDAYGQFRGYRPVSVC